MAFLTGMTIIDAPASALNNSGEPIENARTENTVSVKFIRTRTGFYPYVSAQAFRYWLRNTLERYPELGWKPSPVYREEKVAYVDANPLEYWDDDLLGYMRAPSKKAGKKEEREADAAFAKMTPLEDEKGNPTTVTRVSPFRVSTLVSIAPLYQIPSDFGTMTRQEGDPVPFEHQFYRATLHGLFSLNLDTAGKFLYSRRSGYQNLDAVRTRLAEERGLEHLPKEMAYRLPLAERVRRVQALLEGMARLEGGAKQALHYTDVSPALVMMAVTRGGNNIFGYVAQADSRGELTLHIPALEEAMRVFAADLLSPVFIGWKEGYCQPERERVLAEPFVAQAVAEKRIIVSHPREAFQAMAQALGANGAAWMG